MFLHRLQQRSLGLGWRTIDLVGKEHIGENRSLHEDHLAFIAGLLKNLGACNVGRHQIGSKLNALKLQIEKLG